MDLYHVLNRGVDKRKIVMNDRDRMRFVRNLYEMNDSEPVKNLWFHFNKNTSPASDVGRHYERDKLVQIHGWCLMDNHYHLLLSELQENGISMFLKKINMGYAKYFNEKYDRSGALFQGKTKRKLIDSDAYMLHILNYIHFNPLDYSKGTKGWRGRKIDNAQTALAQLNEYRWSSYLDYMGQDNFPTLIETSLMDDLFDDYTVEVKDI